MRLLTLLPALLLFAALPATAAADAPRCGEYRSADGGITLVFESPTRGYRTLEGQERAPLRIDRSAGDLQLVLLDDGVATAIGVAADGTHVDDSVASYTLHRPQACQRTPTGRTDGCLAHPARCIARLAGAPPEQAQRACEEGVGAGCSALLRHFLAAAASGAVQQEAPLPATQRAILQRLCLQQRSGRFCTGVAEQQLIALEPALAVQALQVVCDAGRASACERTAPLLELGADLRLVPARRLPCGRYRADGGVVDTLDFGDGAQAGLHEGAIHLQQNGQTLVLRQLGNGDLLGMDTQTGYQRYRPFSNARCRTAPGHDH
ncbi:hypothetical protein [Stenotrophomonas beteli]|jgi:hypothetical protein|uniref:Uncharacterized protein n=1 Tax=Stenotrophomonas beteli TaxID=3384461 RepID=A0A0R0B6E4_9GAMM|nr:hypothetical protein [Stenotrophomonas maltophilia]KRG48600.1 hypothetical protein ARC23_01870 [Stenotrophomonas maltophilia]